MASIHVMDEILANKIAAGEVVERVSSVVKELVENSIDAGSTEIKIELIEAGTKEIKVIDNGIGMDRDDAINCFGRHATSKIKNEEDLYHIETLGFRGEALASISSVSQIELITSTGSVGTIVKINGGKIESVSNGDARKGTIMCVKNLFYNTPARLKHLKSLYTELANITDYVNKIALSHTDIKFVLSNNDNIILNTDGKNNLLKTISDIYGIKVAKKMLEVSAKDNDYVVSGYISLPEIHRSTRNAIVTLVNGRVVRNTTLNRTINDSYHSFKPDNRYPVIVLNIEVDPTLVDVNIHPTKMDVKFSKFEELQTLVSNMIKEKITHRTLIPHIIEQPKKEEEKKYEPIKIDFDAIISDNVDDLFINEDFEKEKVSMLKEVTSDKQEQLELENENIFKEDVVDKKERFPDMTPIGVLHLTYIVCQNELGVYLIDQHAAKERCNYELFKKQMGNPNSKPIALMFPITLEFPMNEYIILKEHFDILEQMNFKVEEFGMNSIIVKEHPIWIHEDYVEETIRRLMEAIIQKGSKFSLEKFNEKEATMLSCKMAIKANQYISPEEIDALLKDLRKCDNPFNCPHGRPTTIFFSNYDLEKMFKRSGF